MTKITSSLFPFKLTSTEDKITANAGLCLFGEFLHSQCFSKLVDENVCGFKSNHSYKPSEYVVPLLLMLHGGGRYIEDVREIANDEALLQLLQISSIPSSSAIGDWLRFIGDVKGGLSGLSNCNRAILKRGLKRTGKKEFTLDIDATQIVAEKQSARITYKGEQGYMPIVGHIQETGMVIHGFSLLELLLVIGIIAALVGLAMPYYQDYVGESKNAVMRANLQVLKRALMDYKADKGEYPDPTILSADLVPKYIREFPVDPEQHAVASWGYHFPVPLDPTQYKLADKY